MRLRFLVGLVIGLAALAVATTAGAHTELRLARPGDGETVGGTIDVIEIEFVTRVLADGFSVTITDPDGEPVTPDGSASLDDRRLILRQPIEPLTEAGDYTVTYTVVAEDGDTVSDEFTFTYRADAPGPAAELSEPGDDGGVGTGTIVLVAALVVVGVGAGSIAVRERVRSG